MVLHDLSCALAVIAILSGDVPGDSQRYEISCSGDVSIGEEKGQESFVWIVDEAAPDREKIYHLGKSVCDQRLTCEVEIKPYHISVHTTSEHEEGKAKIFADIEGKLNRVTGSATIEGYLIVTENGHSERHQMVGLYTCEKHPFKRVI